MNFKLKTPCANCPFRTDVKAYLTQGRAEEIAEGITTEQQTFTCHKTLSRDDDGNTLNSQQEQHCAGALIMLEHMDKPNQMMRIAERLGMYDRRQLDMDAPVFKTDVEFINHFEE